MFKLIHMAHLLPIFIIGKDVFKYIKRKFIRAIKGKVQRQAITVNIREVFNQLRVIFTFFLQKGIF